jgi:pectate lyase
VAATSDDCIGWASETLGSQVGTTGGGPEDSATPVATLSAFQSSATGTTPRVLRLTASMTGDVTIGSNKTILADLGVVFTGHLQLSGSVNVILKNLKVVGYNCSDSPSDCSGGADAISVRDSAHHICITHCDISDGSDGNLDITAMADYVTVAWTKFSYSTRRTIGGGHMFSNLIGSDDAATEDTGHLNVTMHHDWWADNVNQRMPRVRFGKVHLFNNLYTPTGSSYCVGAGVGCNVRLQNNVFIGARNPTDVTNYADSASVCASFGNIYTTTTGTHNDLNAANVFTPPYAFTLEDASTVEAAVRNGAGPK